MDRRKFMTIVGAAAATAAAAPLVAAQAKLAPDSAVRALAIGKEKLMIVSTPTGRMTWVEKHYKYGRGDKIDKIFGRTPCMVLNDHDFGVIAVDAVG